MESYSCCFCGKTIKPSSVDPVQIAVQTAILQPASDDSGQAFYCHFECLKKAMHAEARDYLLEEK